MNLLSIAVAVCSLFFLKSVRSRVLRDSACPSAEDVNPCECTSNPYAVLNCSNVQDAEELRRVFQNSEGFSYKEIHMEHSTLAYLPHDMFEHTPVKNLYLKNVTLAELFDTPPNALDEVKSLSIENSHVVNSNHSWSLLEPLTQLLSLTVSCNPVEVLDSTFAEAVPEGLQQLSFYSTETRRIEPGTFTKLANLKKVAFESCRLTQLSRDMFPAPSGIQSLYFDDNKITSIPRDLFTQMPDLQTIDLKNNLISTIPEAAFESNVGRISFLWFDGNPLKCDCLLQWLVNDKPSQLRGRCEAPKSIYGRHLKDLSSDDFNC